MLNQSLLPEINVVWAVLNIYLTDFHFLLNFLNNILIHDWNVQH